MSQKHRRVAADWRHLRLYIAPDNPAGRNLAQQMQQQGSVVLGMVDNLKTGSDIINLAKDAQPHDAILLAKSDFQQAIAEGLVQRGFAAQQIWLLDGGQPDSFVPYQPKTRWQRLQDQVRLWADRLLSLLPQVAVVYYADHYADSNILVAFDQHQRQYPDVYLVVNQSQQQFHPRQVRSQWYGRWLMYRARVFVLDHESTDPLFNRRRVHSHVVQLWHGLPFKYLAGNRHFSHIDDHSFVSSSSWFNQHIFPTMFKARHFMALGYPRNDALLQPKSARCWHNALPLSQFEQLCAGQKLLVFMPTFRDNGNNLHPIDWPLLQQFLQQHQAVLVMKSHPFLAPFSQLRPQPGCDRIFHYPGRANIYPWLADADVLITDYSSVAFDFLLCNKPVVHFIYDIEAYAKVRGKFVLPQQDFIAGAMARDFPQLLQQLDRALTHDDFAQHRQALQQKYAMINQVSCPALISYVQQLRGQPTT